MSGDPRLNAQLLTKRSELNGIPNNLCYGNNRKRQHSDVGVIGRNCKTKSKTVSSSRYV